MTKPLALVFYEKLLPGTQLVNRLQDLNYRVQTVPSGSTILATAEKEKPMVLFADLVATRVNVALAISELRQNPTTNHLPVIAFVDEKDTKSQKAALEAGSTLVVNEAALLNHLQQFLEQALHLD